MLYTQIPMYFCLVIKKAHYRFPIQTSKKENFQRTYWHRPHPHLRDRELDLRHHRNHHPLLPCPSVLRFPCFHPVLYEVAQQQIEWVLHYLEE